MPVVCIAEKPETFIIVARLLRQPTAFQLITSRLFNFVSVQSHTNSKGNAPVRSASSFDYADMVKRSLEEVSRH